MKEQLMNKFKEVFGEPETAIDSGDIQTFFAPGRVNLIGEHTDYNGGHVFPCALTIGTYAVVRKNPDKLLRFYSMSFEQTGVISSTIENLQYDKGDDWANYPKAVIWALEQKGYKIHQGMDILYYGNIPNQSGLSSSASIEVLTGYIVKELFHFNLDMVELAKICQYAENQFIGVNCGIMDQFAIAMGKKGYAIFLDTINLTYEYAPLKLKGMKIVIANTNKKRGLGDSKYNERRKECETALLDLQSVVNIQSLGELNEEEFEAYQSAIKDPICRKRAKHAVYENQRTIKAVEALKDSDINLFGQLMNASHISLRDDYEVTGYELDTLVEVAWKQEGVFGSRMTGAGFGGCTVSVVDESLVEHFIDEVSKEYELKVGYKADFYVVDVGNGPERI